MAVCRKFNARPSPHVMSLLLDVFSFLTMGAVGLNLTFGLWIVLQILLSVGEWYCRYNEVAWPHYVQLTEVTHSM